MRPLNVFWLIFCLFLESMPAIARAACDAQTLGSIAARSTETTQDLEHFFNNPGLAANGKRVRVKPVSSIQIPPAEMQSLTADLETLMQEAATGYADLFFNPGNPQQVFVKRKGSAEFYAFNRTTSSSVNSNGTTITEVIYNFSKKVTDVPPGVKEVYPALVNGTENAREMALAEKLTGQARGRELPVDLQGMNVQRLQGMTSAELAEYVRRTGDFPYVPPSRSFDIPVRQCKGKPCYEDAFGNLWTRGASRTKGDAFEWDVQLGSTDSWAAEFAAAGKGYVNVSIKGRITH